MKLALRIAYHLGIALMTAGAWGAILYLDSVNIPHHRTALNFAAAAFIVGGTLLVLSGIGEHFHERRIQSRK